MIYYKIWYDNIIRIDFLYKFNISNSYNIPYINKVTINARLQVVKYHQSNTMHLITSFMLITNQKPKVNKSLKLINTFKFEEDSFININVTLRKKRAFNLLANVALLISYNIKKLSLLRLDKMNCFSIGLNNLSLFPYMISYQNKLLYNIITLNISFTLFNFNVLKFLISSLEIQYE